MEYSCNSTEDASSDQKKETDQKDQHMEVVKRCFKLYENIDQRLFRAKRLCGIKHYKGFTYSELLEDLMTSTTEQVEEIYKHLEEYEPRLTKTEKRLEQELADMNVDLIEEWMKFWGNAKKSLGSLGKKIRKFGRLVKKMM